MRGIYAITNIVSDTVYYGQASQINSRLNNHKLALKKNIHENPRLQNSYNKHGEESFIFTPIYIIKEKQIDLTLLEKKCIEEAYFLGLKVFNIRSPELKDKLSDETKKKMSLAKIGNKYALGCKRSENWIEALRLRSLGKKYNLGWTPSEETREKMRLMRLGKKTSEETRKKISISNKGRVSPRKGKKCSEETRKKISEKAKEQWLREGMRERLSEAHKRKRA